MRCGIWIVSFAVLAVNSPLVSADPATSVLRLTPVSYTELDDLEAACGTHFGKNASVGDWNEVVDSYSTYGARFADELGLGGTTFNALVQRDGERWYTGSRHYFIARHNGDLPAGFLSHDDIGDHFIDLGSWFDRNMPVLCSVPVPVSLRLTPTNYTELDDLEAACKDHYGNLAVLSDWSDVVDAYDAYGPQ